MDTISSRIAIIDRTFLFLIFPIDILLLDPHHYQLKIENSNYLEVTEVTVADKVDVEDD